MSREGMGRIGSVYIEFLCCEKGWSGEDRLTLECCVVRRDGRMRICGHRNFVCEKG